MKSKFRFILIIIGLALIGGVTFLWNSQVKNAFYKASAPSQKFLWSKGSDLAGFLSSFFQGHALKSENEKLTSELMELKKQLSALEQERTENLELRSALGIQNEKKWQLAAADVLNKDSNRDIITVSLGQNHDITTGMTVVTSQGALVGKVTDVFPNFAKVLLISDTESSFNVEILSADKPSGTAKGKGNFKLSFDYIPKEAVISQGELVLTSAMGDAFPKGIMVGEVDAYKKNDAEPYQSGLIKPYFLKNQLKSVFIIREIR